MMCYVVLKLVVVLFIPCVARMHCRAMNVLEELESLKGTLYSGVCALHYLPKS